MRSDVNVGSKELAKSIMLGDSLWICLWNFVWVVVVVDVVLVVSVLKNQWLWSLLWLIVLLVVFLMNKTESVEGLLVVWEVIVTPVFDTYSSAVITVVHLCWPSLEVNFTLLVPWSLSRNPAIVKMVS